MTMLMAMPCHIDWFHFITQKAYHSLANIDEMFLSVGYFDKIEGNLVSFSCLDDPLGIAALLQGEPAALLRVVRLCKVLERFGISGSEKSTALQSPLIEIASGSHTKYCPDTFCFSS